MGGPQVTPIELGRKGPSCGLRGPKVTPIELAGFEGGPPVATTGDTPIELAEKEGAFLGPGGPEATPPRQLPPHR